MSLVEFFSWFVAFLIFVIILDQWQKRKIMKNVKIPGPKGLPLLGNVIEGVRYSHYGKLYEVKSPSHFTKLIFLSEQM